MNKALPLLLAALGTLFTSCGLESLSNRQNAQLVAEFADGTTLLRVRPLDGSTADTCPELSGATATQDGVAMTPTKGGFVSAVPSPFPTGGCVEFTWTAPFDAARDPNVPVAFTLRQGSQIWQLVVAQVAAPLPIAVTSAGGLLGTSHFFSREPVAHAGRPISTSVGFQGPVAGSEGAWVQAVQDVEGGLTLSIPLTSARGAGTLEFRTRVEAEVTRCTGAPSCRATYQTVQQAAFTVW